MLACGDVGCLRGKIFDSFWSVLLLIPSCKPIGSVKIVGSPDFTSEIIYYSFEGWLCRGTIYYNWMGWLCKGTSTKFESYFVWLELGRSVDLSILCQYVLNSYFDFWLDDFSPKCFLALKSILKSKLVRLSSLIIKEDSLVCIRASFGIN